MNKPDLTISRLRQALQTALQQLQTLEQILSREQTALRQLNLEELQSIPEEKERVRQDTEKSSHEAQIVAQELGHEASPEGLMNCLTTLKKSSSEIANIRWELEQAGQRCRRLNKKNGQLINSSADQLSEMLSIFKRGKGEKNATYDSRGLTTPEQSSLSSLNRA